MAPDSKIVRSSSCNTGTANYQIDNTGILRISDLAETRMACAPDVQKAFYSLLLERRLGTVVYRAKFAPTVFAARQLVNHGHVLVNGRKCNIASAMVKPGDVITLSEKGKQMALVLEAAQSSERDVPEYVTVDGLSATYVRVPTLDEVPYPVKMEPNLVVEYYSS